MVRPSTRRDAARWLRQKFEVSERRACRVVGLHRSTNRYVAKRGDNEELRKAIIEVAHAQPRFGYRRVHWSVRRMGFEVGLRQVRRIYAEQGLSVRRRLRRRLKPALRRPMTPATKPNERWSMDFVHDQLADGRCFRVFAVVDDFTRESVVLAVGMSLTSADIAVALREAMLERGKPERVGCDNGPEFRSGHFQRWAATQGIDLQFIDPGKPMQNAFVESFNGRFRDECLSVSWFLSLADARRRIAAWRDTYNEWRRHGSLGNTSPKEFRLAFSQAA